MAAQPVSEVLARLRSIHRRLSDQYISFSETVSCSRVRTALDCMARHEEQIESWLKDHEAHTDSGVLNTWIQFAPGFALDRLSPELHENQSTEELLDAARELDQKLLVLYRRLADAASAPRVREMFGNLFSLVESKDLQFTRTAVEMSDE